MSLATPGVSRSYRRHCTSKEGVKTLLREPDAGNPPVRFDEREVETEHGMRLVRHRRGNPETEYVEA